MPLPDTLRVKLSSESVGSIAITPVVVQEMRLCEIVELMLPLAGKDDARIRELLRRGSLVSGASRFRWEGFEADAMLLRQMLEGFPDADPSLPFRPQSCVRVVLRGPVARIEIPVEAAGKRAFLKHRSYRDVLFQLAEETAPVYVDYSYKDRADRYELRLTSTAAALVRNEASLLPFSALAAQIRAASLDFLELHSRR